MIEREELLLNSFPRGLVTPPPSKSISHRALICAALAGGEGAIGMIKNLGDSDDISATRAGILRIVGARDTDTSASTGEPASAPAAALNNTAAPAAPSSNPVTVPNPASAPKLTPAGEIDCGESGSTLRFLIPIAAARGGAWHFTGSKRLMERPLSVYDDLFRAQQTDAGVFLNGRLFPGIYELRGDVSSQFISGLLFALPLLSGDSEIRLLTPLESSAYVDLTIDVMRAYGVYVEKKPANGTGNTAAPAYGEECTQREVHKQNNKLLIFYIKGNQRYRQTPFRVEADYSQAAFFLCAGALGCDLALSGLRAESLQGDRRILNILQEMGATIQYEPSPTAFSEYPAHTITEHAGTFVPSPTAQIRVSPPAEGLHGIRIDVSEIPDLVPPLAALAACCHGTTRIENARRLRMKESDRLHALTEVLGALGADIAEEEDALVIHGKERLSGGNVDAWNDHRIAMAAALAAIKCEHAVNLSGFNSVRKSYPDFWRDWRGE